MQGHIMRGVINRPLNKSWTVKRCVDWLIPHPIKDNGITDAALAVLFVSEEMSTGKTDDGWDKTWRYFSMEMNESNNQSVDSVIITKMERTTTQY
eukprot:scaffold86231_cov37-Cyclotella_meneghiniana.AAC.2